MQQKGLWHPQQKKRRSGENNNIIVRASICFSAEGFVDRKQTNVKFSRTVIRSSARY